MADDYINSLGGSPPEGAPSSGGTNAGTTADILRNQVLSQLITEIDALTATFNAIAGVTNGQ